MFRILFKIFITFLVALLISTFAKSQTRYAVLPFQNMEGKIDLNIWSYKLQDSLQKALMKLDPENKFMQIVPADSIEDALAEINLDPTKGAEMKKTRPCVVLSPDELNDFLETAIIAPLTSTRKKYKFRVNTIFQEKNGAVALDQLRTVDKSRLIKKIGHLENKTIENIKEILKEMLIK